MLLNLCVLHCTCKVYLNRRHRRVLTGGQCKILQRRDLSREVKRLCCLCGSRFSCGIIVQCAVSELTQQSIQNYRTQSLPYFLVSLILQILTRIALWVAIFITVSTLYFVSSIAHLSTQEPPAILPPGSIVIKRFFFYWYFVIIALLCISGRCAICLIELDRCYI